MKHAVVDAASTSKRAFTLRAFSMICFAGYESAAIPTREKFREEFVSIHKQIFGRPATHVDVHHTCAHAKAPLYTSCWGELMMYYLPA